MLASSKAKQVAVSFSRLAVTGIVTFGIGAFSIVERYNNYWNKTIFRVQTVDFNMLSHTLPTKLSYAIIKNQPKEVQRTLDSNYSLFGLIVTDPSGQKIIASSGKGTTYKSWSKALEPQQLQKNHYDLLLDPPPLFSQWSYEDPRALERSATSFTNQGRVIGRVYYVRGGKPSFQDDFSKWLSNPISESSRAEIYTMTMLACLGGGFAFWSLWEYLLYKKRVQKKEAEREAERKEEEARRQQEELRREAERKEEEARRQQEELRREAERKEEEARRQQEELRREAERKEEEARRQQEELRREAERKEEEAKQREELLIQQNQTLVLQLEERVNQIEVLQEQWEKERFDSIKQAKELRSHNEQLQQEISQLRETMKLLPAVANSQSTQAELDRTRQEAESACQRQHQQKEEIERLNHQLQVYQNQLSEVRQKGSEFKKLQYQIEEIKAARSQAESEMKELRNSEYRSRETIATLEERLLRERGIQEQLNKQLDILQHSLLKSQQQEQESRQKAERASEQMRVLSEEMERLREEMGKHPLNKFEKSILNCLQTGLTHKEILTQYDAGSGSSNSKFIDFVVVMNNCIIAIEAKSYEGFIDSIGDTRNTKWVCKKESLKISINACWGLNPYQQVKTYVDSLLGRFKSNKVIQFSKPLVYGVVVFPSRAEINQNITNNVGGYFRVTTLNNLLEVIKSLEVEAKSRNQDRTSHTDHMQFLTGTSDRLSA